MKISSIARRFGFSLVEVILGSIIIAGFVASTVFTAGEIGKAKRDMLAKRDLNTWANLQSQFASYGVQAPSGKTDVWGTGTGEFGLLYQDLSSSTSNATFSVPSAGENLAASIVTTYGRLGKSACVSAFLLDLNYYATSSVTVAPRENLGTVGLSLMDRDTYSATYVSTYSSTGSASSGSTNSGSVSASSSDPMLKPDSLFNFGVTVAIAYPTVSSSGTTYSISSSSTLTLDALTQIDWSDSNPIYVLVSASSGTISSASATLNGTALSSGSYGSYTYAYPIKLSSLEYLSSNSVTIVGTAKNSAGTSVSSTITLTFTQITPVFAFYRYNTASGTLKAASSLSTVTVYDVCQPSTTVYSSGYNAFRAYITTLNGTTYSSVPNYSYILSNLYLYSYLDNYISSSSTTSYTLLSGGTLSSSGYTTITLPAADFLSTATKYTWRATNKGDSISTSAIPWGALFATGSASQVLTISTKALPSVSFTPTTGNKITSTSGVTAYVASGSYIMSTGAYDASYPLYYIYYNYGTSSLTALSTPTTSSYSGYISSYTGAMSFSSITSASTVYVKAIALANSTYSLFLAANTVSSAYYTYESDKEAKTVMKVNYITDTLDYYVQGSIQVLKADGFTLNGSYSMGLKLYVTGYPTVNCSNVAAYVYNSETDYDAASSSQKLSRCSVIGAAYTAGSANNKSISVNSGYTSSGVTISVGSISTSYALPIVTNSTTEVALQTAPTTSTTSSTNSVTMTSSGVTLTPGTYNNYYWFNSSGYTLTLKGAGDYYIYGMCFNNPGSIVATEAGANLHVTSLTLSNSNFTCTTSSGALSSVSGGSVIGSASAPITVYMDGSTTSSTIDFKGQLYGTFISNGHVNLTNCMVMGKIECNSINMNSGCYLFIKSW